MTQFLIRRLLRGLLVMVGISIASFLLLELAPGDFFAEARLNSPISAAMLSALRSQYGLDRSIFAKYAFWVGSVSRGDWGFSLSYNMPAAPLLWSRLQNTLILTGGAAILAWLIAIPLGVWTAATRNAFTRACLRSTMSLLLAIPEVLVVLGLLLIAARTGVFAMGGMMSPAHSGVTVWIKLRDFANHLALPLIALVLSSLPTLVTHVGSAMDTVLNSPCIVSARAGGIPRARLLYRHALPNAASPLISLFGLSVGALLSSSLLVEATVGWPGLGRLLLEASLQRDLYVVVDVVMLSAVFLIAGNFLSDLLLYWADPRIRRP